MLPVWNAQFAKPLVNQLIALVQRDQLAAIAIVNPGLPPIMEFHKGPTTRSASPWLVVIIDHVVFEREVLGTRQSLVYILMIVDVMGSDYEYAMDTAQDYIRVLDMIVTSAPMSDYTTPLPIVHTTVPSGITTPNAPDTVKDCFVYQQKYGMRTTVGITEPVLTASLSLWIYLEET